MKICMELSDLLFLMSRSLLEHTDDANKAVCSIEGRLYGSVLYKGEYDMNFDEFNKMCQQERANARAHLERLNREGE